MVPLRLHLCTTFPLILKGFKANKKRCRKKMKPTHSQKNSWRNAVEDFFLERAHAFPTFFSFIKGGKVHIFYLVRRKLCGEMRDACLSSFSLLLSLFSLRVRGRPGGRSQEEAQIESGEGWGVEWWKEIPSYPFIFCLSVRKRRYADIPLFAPIASHLSFSPQKRSWRINKQKGESEKEEFLSFSISISFSTFLPSLSRPHARLLSKHFFSAPTHFPPYFGGEEKRYKILSCVLALARDTRCPPTPTKRKSPLLGPLHLGGRGIIDPPPNMPIQSGPKKWKRGGGGNKCGVGRTHSREKKKWFPPSKLFRISLFRKKVRRCFFVSAKGEENWKVSLG